MKFGALRSVGHNIADSLASGCSLLIGVYDLSIFGEARRSPEGFIEVDFLAGVATGGQLSPELAGAITRYREVLPSLCERQGVPPAAFRKLRARYVSSGFSATFVVTVEDVEGRASVDTYVGVPGARPRVLDRLGRIRTVRPPVLRPGPNAP